MVILFYYIDDIEKRILIYYTRWAFEKVVSIRTYATSTKQVNDAERSRVLLCAGKAKHAERLGPLELLAPPFRGEKVENKL